MKSIAIALLLALAAHTAHADSDTATATAPAEKSTATALALAIGTPLAGLGVVYGSYAINSDSLSVVGMGIMVLGPSAGHWYAGQTLTIGLGARIAGAAMFVGGALDGLDFGCGPSNPCKPERGDDALMLAGGALLVGGTIYDLVTTPGAVDDYNRAHDHDITFAPTVLRDARGDTAPGLALIGRF